MAALTWPVWRAILDPGQVDICEDDTDAWETAEAIGVVEVVEWGPYGGQDATQELTGLGESFVARLREKLDGLSPLQRTILRRCAQYPTGIAPAWGPAFRALRRKGLCVRGRPTDAYVTATVQGRAALHLLGEASRG
jgi:hypothetical protein